MTIRAFAKINLSLRIRQARPDGFHDVQTILQAIDLADRVTCAARRGPLRIRCSTPGVPVDRTNLAWRAAEQLWAAAGRQGEPRDAVITLGKKIPMGAGLGGGSSDAAAALLGLRRLWRVRVADDELYAIAARLGSDVPFFLIGGTALALGRGEEVYPLEDLPPLPVVLVLPPFGVATRDAYRWLDEDRAEGVRPLSSSHSGEHTPKRGLPPFLYAPLVNDLEPPVIERHPLIGELKSRLAALGAVMAAMSGSGSAVFGVFATAAAAGAAARGLKRAGAPAVYARFLPRAKA